MAVTRAIATTARAKATVSAGESLLLQLFAHSRERVSWKWILIRRCCNKTKFKSNSIVIRCKSVKIVCTYDEYPLRARLRTNVCEDNGTHECYTVEMWHEIFQKKKQFHHFKWIIFLSYIFDITYSSSSLLSVCFFSSFTWLEHKHPFHVLSVGNLPHVIVLFGCCFFFIAANRISVMLQVYAIHKVVNLNRDIKRISLFKCERREGTRWTYWHEPKE